MRPQVLALLLLLLLAGPASAVTIDWVLVGNPGNAPDVAENCYSADCGSVPYAYSISKYEVTNAQYAEFLNAKAASDTLGLYNTSMGSDAAFGGITRSGSSGSYTYTAKAGFADKPAVYVSFFDALRFANWLNNGQGSGDTETGAYTLLGGTPTPSNQFLVGRNVDADIFLTSENEWYKAAYYSSVGVYFDYPTGTNSETGCVPSAGDTGNSANCFSFDTNPNTALSDAGAYGLSDSPYGTFDQGGNVWEWNETYVSGGNRGRRGSSWFNGGGSYLAAAYRDFAGATIEHNTIGFRVATLVPEPSTGGLVMAGLLGLAARPQRRTWRHPR